MDNTEINYGKIGIEEIRYANFGERLIALIIDGIIFWCIYLIIFRIFFPSSFSNFDYGNLIQEIYSGKFNPLEYFNNLLRFFLSWIIFFLITIFYNIFLIGKFGATMGKMIVGIKVVDENGRKISYGTAFIREFIVKNLVYPIIFFIFYLGYLWALWDKKRQTWHDKIARTIVIKE